MASVREFYDAIAEHYHLIFEDWDRSIARQADVLAPLLTQRWGGGVRHVLDAAVGIGTQAIGLASRGFQVVGSDLAAAAVMRARREAELRELILPVVCADFRSLPFSDGSADVVLVCDNALPHLLSLPEISIALAELRRCVRPGGGCLISMRDYTSPRAPGTVEVRPYGTREWKGAQYFAEQEWRWEGSTYQLLIRIRPVDVGGKGGSLEVETTYLAVPVDKVRALMVDAGFTDVQRLDGLYYQPLLLGSVPEDSG
jgi:SAM-dependent methyltransferase